MFLHSVLLEGLKYYANEPQKLGKTFLRLVIRILTFYECETELYFNVKERDFDKHAQYYGAEPKSQELLREDKHLREFFEVGFFVAFLITSSLDVTKTGGIISGRALEEPN